MLCAALSSLGPRLCLRLLRVSERTAPEGALLILLAAPLLVRGDDLLYRAAACGAALAALDDVGERASERTLDERGRVETVHGRAAMWLAEGGGGLGALLRFRVG